MTFAFEHECPQCGAGLKLEETDRILICPYCKVRNVINAPEPWRFVLPAAAFPDRSPIYVPYLRFRGSVYSCQHNHTINFQIVDTTQLGMSFTGLSSSLGLRPQAMKMRFAPADTPATFLKCFLKVNDALTSLENRWDGQSLEKVFLRASIGETISLIYLPLIIRDQMVLDGVTGNPLARLPSDRDPFGPAIIDTGQWQPDFLAALCPQCGWNLEGEKESIVLFCRNCDTVWKTGNREFVGVSYAIADPEGDGVSCLPFWRMSVRAPGLKIHSFADFMRITNQPRAILGKWENQELRFWCPAFKISPKVFLNLACALTVGQKNFTAQEGIGDKRLSPVTLPPGEAIESLRLILAQAAVSKKKVFPLLPEVNFSIQEITLVYLPARDSGLELIIEPFNVAVNKRTLAFGNRL